MSDTEEFQAEFEQLAQANDGGDGAIGIVIASTGTITVERADGSTDQLSAGDRVYEDDVILTADESTVGIRFADDSRFSLGEEGQMQLDSFVYDASAGTGSSLVDVAYGTFAFVSGMIAKTGDDAMTVNTPTATIGVRGTTVAGDVARDGETEITLLPDTDGTLGEIAVFNDAGLQIMFDAFQRVDVGSDRAPSAPRTIEPSDIRAEVADTVRAIGADPTGRSSGPGDESEGDQEAGPAETGEGADDGAALDADANQASAEPSATEAAESMADVLPAEPLQVQAMMADPNDAAIAQAPIDAPVQSVSSSADGEKLIITLADGTVFEVPMADAQDGLIAGPNGQSIDIGGFTAEARQSEQQRFSEEEEEDEAKSEFREDARTLETAALNDGDVEKSDAPLSNDVLTFTPDALSDASHAAADLESDTLRVYSEAASLPDTSAVPPSDLRENASTDLGVNAATPSETVNNAQARVSADSFILTPASGTSEAVAGPRGPTDFARPPRPNADEATDRGTSDSPGGGQTHFSLGSAADAFRDLADTPLDQRNDRPAAFENDEPQRDQSLGSISDPSSGQVPTSVHLINGSVDRDPLVSLSDTVPLPADPEEEGRTADTAPQNAPKPDTIAAEGSELEPLAPLDVALDTSLEPVIAGLDDGHLQPSLQQAPDESDATTDLILSVDDLLPKAGDLQGLNTLSGPPPEDQEPKPVEGKESPGSLDSGIMLDSQISLTTNAPEPDSIV